jgi:AcrR family transcriptional regulator
MDCGRAMLEDKGYAATTIEDIAAAAGASRATFYLHFNTKLDLVQAIRAATDPRFADRYRQLDEALASSTRFSRAKLREWLASALEFWMANGKFIDVWRQATVVEPAATHDEYALSEELVGNLRNYLERNGEHPEESRQRAIMLERMTAHLFEELSMGQHRLDNDIALDLLVDLWWTVFRPPRRR